jgi:hypothetical protein
MRLYNGGLVLHRSNDFHGIYSKTLILFLFSRNPLFKSLDHSNSKTAIIIVKILEYINNKNNPHFLIYATSFLKYESPYQMKKQRTSKDIESCLYSINK